MENSTKRNKLPITNRRLGVVAASSYAPASNPGLPYWSTGLSPSDYAGFTSLLLHTGQQQMACIFRLPGWIPELADQELFLYTA